VRICGATTGYETDVLDHTQDFGRTGVVILITDPRA